ncbi:hypothetical protein C457_15250 [Haloferax prahovense DSM 18310]|uniref:Ig-like domain-containing protein n=1 Tax=Haloferax prahovense (strain DSM 18310 / JCM 13924 / TL6) TaxID=1227461 RepID=M0G5Q2_HALPT|nr:hypothetical protein [Haloferax prahovense]ELZ66144.1 hypothetical protein C457_15250 [Haloferax prahovense DSM 18310]
MERRTLLSLLAGGLAGLAGCGTPEWETETPTPEEGTDAPIETPTTEARVERSLTLWNPTPDPVFTTVVGVRDDRDVFFENRDLLPGERAGLSVAVPTGETAVLVETDTGLRARSTWTVDAAFEGLEVVLGRGSAEFWRTVSCDARGECSLAAATPDDGPRIDLPLVGDGSSRWYAPAGVVVENPGPETTARLRIDLGNTVLVDQAYRVPSGARLSIPVTYRSGDYRVAVETDERRVETGWPVPDEPTKYVDVSSGATGCGPSNTTLTIANRDDEPHRLSLRVDAASGDESFDRVLALAPGEVRELVPVTTSGAHAVSASLETGAAVSGTWWSCPPRGPASVVVDATGTVSLRVAGPQPG